MKEIVTLIGYIVKQILELFDSFAPAQNATFDDIETQIRSVMLEIGRRIVETIVKVRGTGYMGETIQTPSGELATYHRSRTIKTLMGPVEVVRAYYPLEKGGGGYFPGLITSGSTILNDHISPWDTEHHIRCSLGKRAVKHG
jgi:hypothetical protein